MTELHKFITTQKELDNEFDFVKLKSKLIDSLGEGLKIKENDTLSLFYYDTRYYTVENIINEDDKHLAVSLRSVIVDKSTLDIIASQHNNIIYNVDALNIIRQHDWNNIVISPCYEGTLMSVYYHNDAWQVSTHKCLDAYSTKWNKRTYGELFEEIMDFDFNDLDKQFYYNFILVHKDNKILIDYDKSELILSSVIDKQTHLENREYEFLDKNELQFSNLQETLNYLSTVGRNDFNNKKLTTEGVIIKVYEGEKYKSAFQTLKIQTHIYSNVMKLKPNNANVYHNMLELYQKNKLGQLSQFILNNKEIVKLINNSMRELSVSILNLYHNTRNKNNEEIYQALPNSYKVILFQLHGLFKSKDTSIGIHDVYHFLKEIESDHLRKLYVDYCEKSNKFFINTDVIQFGNLLKYD